ncbi:ohcu decarboxylase protein [Moniliophthora roreri MCA 2997]|uniref:Ohcu decarboxylase protein n=2 Tax=Moniliophthora roreri TaxID=221103 RepID=V2XVG5_MONRO|nr:ohcu decarboxylase protein [Moniliophthora roreri MCA 2997]KAI3600479.1 ohcu decarboxylase protein [Moniliophthora roreri]
MTTLPTLDDVQNGQSSPSSSLATALSILFEYSDILTSTLEPQLRRILAARNEPLTSFAQLVDLSITQIQLWEKNLQAQFIAGHPRIGESKNLSALSAKEQGTTSPSSTSSVTPEVLARLAHLNACYEKRYPGLRYIIFVNGRSRAAVAAIMEDQLGLSHSLSPDQPEVDRLESLTVGEEEWTKELERAVVDVGLIAKSRLKTLGTE